MLYSKDDITEAFKDDELHISTNSITINSITIDSRVITNGGMFFAIKVLTMTDINTSKVQLKMAQFALSASTCQRTTKPLMQALLW